MQVPQSEPELVAEAVQRRTCAGDKIWAGRVHIGFKDKGFGQGLEFRVSGRVGIERAQVQPITLGTTPQLIGIS